MNKTKHSGMRCVRYRTYHGKKVCADWVRKVKRK